MVEKVGLILMKIMKYVPSKEFEVDGNVNGADEVQLTYFGARYYDPEVGMWNGTDKAGQFTNSYGYTTNPISYIDPDGNYVLGAIIGAVVGAYLGGVASSGYLNPGEWSEGDWLSAGIGAISGAMQGSALEDGIMLKHFGKLTNMPKTSYGLNAYVHARGGAVVIRNSNIEKAFKLGGQKPMQEAVDYVAIREGIVGNFKYNEFPGDIHIPENARGFTESASKSYIYNEAFKLPSGKFDPTSVVSTVYHEGVHQVNYIKPTSVNMVNKAEYLAYGRTLLNAKSLHLSQSLINYNKFQVNQYAKLLNIGF